MRQTKSTMIVDDTIKGKNQFSVLRARIRKLGSPKGEMFGNHNAFRRFLTMKIRLSLVGTAPLLMHNPRMVDPDFELNRLLKELTSKRKKTDADLKEIERLEWYGGLYEDNGKVVQPTSKVRKCIINTARINKLGKSIERALNFFDLNVPLIYDGPKNIDALWVDPKFTSRLSVGLNGKRVMRVRPQFPPGWKLVLDGLFIEDAGVNFDELSRTVELAGQVEGIGDNRVNGYGRFESTLEEVK